MRNFAKAVTFTGLSALGMIASSAQAGVVLFQDSFDSDFAGSSLNFTAFNNWSVSNGTVDYIRSPNVWGINCVTGCVDMDGSTGNGGRITTNSNFSLLAENTYKLSFDVSGNQRVSSIEALTVGLGSFSTSLSINPGNIFSSYSFFLSGMSFVSSLFFETSSNDNVGAVLDNITFECTTCGIASLSATATVPEPGILGLFAAGLIGLGCARKRKPALSA